MNVRKRSCSTFAMTGAMEIAYLCHTNYYLAQIAESPSQRFTRRTGV